MNLMYNVTKKRHYLNSYFYRSWYNEPL